MDDKEIALPEKPKPPEDGDCCGSGCNPCIFDVYEANLKRWEERCTQIQENPASAEGEVKKRDVYLSETSYKPFRVKSVVPHTRDTKIFTFQAVCESAEGSGSVDLRPLGLVPGQHLIMRGRSPGGGNISRAYTPLRARPGEFDALVKLYPDGPMSRHLASLAVGEVAHFRGPYGGLAYRPNAHRRVLMLCAGTGVAPLFSVVSAIVADEDDETFVRLLLAVRTVDDVLLRDDLRSLAQNWNFTYRVYVSRGTELASAARYGESMVFGRLDRAALAAELGEGNDVQVLICGTDAFNVDMSDHVLASGVEKSNIYVF